LRDQEPITCGAVVDVLADLRGDATGKIGVDAGDQSGRNDRAALKFEGRALCDDLVREITEFGEIGIEERFLLCLTVLIGVLPRKPGL